MDIGKEPLSITDAESVNEAILEMVMGFGEYPETFEPSHENIKWNSINEDSSMSNRRLSQVISADYLRRKHLSHSAVNDADAHYIGWHRRLSRAYFSSAMAGLK